MKRRLVSGLVLAGLVCGLARLQEEGPRRRQARRLRGPRRVGLGRAPRGSGDPAAERAAAMRAAIAKVVNPKGEEPYKGAVGTVKGTVKMDGDPAPDSGFAIPAKCNEAIVTHGKLFRVGQDKTLGDVLVAVTEYSGFVPAKAPAEKITIHGCALSKRTVAMTFGQRLEVANIDPDRLVHALPRRRAFEGGDGGPAERGSREALPTRARVITWCAISSRTRTWSPTSSCWPTPRTT
jgi:hypothetical protein